MVELSSSNIQFFSIFVGFGLVLGSNYFPKTIGPYLQLIGFCVVFIPAFQEWIMPVISAENTCYEIIIDNKARTFDAFLIRTEDSIDDKSNPPIHYRTCWTRWNCQIPGEDEYAEYFGKFSCFRLTSDRGPVERRIKTDRHSVELLGAFFTHRGVAKLLVEDVSGSDEYKGDRVPTFKILRSIQGDYERNTPFGKVLYYIVKGNQKATEIIRRLQSNNNKLVNQVSELRMREKTQKEMRQDSEMLKDSKDAAIGGFINRQRGDQVEGRFFATHVEDQEKDWDKTSKALRQEKYPKWLFPAILGAVVLISLAIILNNPQTVQTITSTFSQTQFQIFIVIVLAFAIVLIYLLRKRLAK